MKRIIFLLAVMVCLVLPVSAAETTDSQLYTRITSAYDSGFYPTVLSLSDEMISAFPYSEYLDRVRFLKGKSYFWLDRYVEAVRQLAPLSGENADASFLLGMSYYRLEDYGAASSAFFNTLALVRKGFDHSVFTERTLLLYSAFALNGCGRRYEASAVLEHALVTYRMEENLAPAVQLLFSIYQENSDYSRIIWLYRQIEGFLVCFPEDWQHLVIYRTAEAYLKNDSYEEALTLYRSLIESGDASYQAAALERAYTISVKQELSGDSGPVSILVEAGRYMNREHELFCDLWLDRALAEWNAGRHETAVECFTYLDEYCHLALVYGDIRNGARIGGYLELSGLYESDYLYSCGRKKEAAEILRERADPSGTLYMDYLVRLADYYFSAGAGYVESCRDNADKAVEYYEKISAAAIEDKKSEIMSLAAEAYFFKAYAYAARAFAGNTGNEREAWKPVLDSCRKRHEITGSYSYPEDLLFADALMLADGSTEAREEALDIFRFLCDAGDGIELLSERLKALLFSGLYEEAFSLYGGMTSGQLELAGEDAAHRLENLAGLAAAGSGQWKFAERLLDEDDSWTLYYKAYSLYRQSRTDEALPLFERFCVQNPYHKMFREACLYASGCALQKGEKEKALEYALKTLDSSKQPEQQLEAAVLCAGIYNDMEQYEASEKLLEDLTVKVKNVSLMLMLSQTYAAHAAVYSEGEPGADRESFIMYLEKADNLLNGMARQFKGEAGMEGLPEEAAFRRAELYYSAREYGKAAELYEEFRNSFKSSSWNGQALFYGALSLKNAGDVEQAVLLFENCARSPARNGETYAFSSLRQLVDIYRDNGDFGDALAAAERIRDEYPEEGSNVGIGAIVRNLQLIVEGGDEAIAGLQMLYENKGGSVTSEGRKTGLSLAAALMGTESRKAEGEAVLLDIIRDGIPNSVSDDARDVTGTALLRMALYYRQQGRDEEAAAYCLDAAGMFVDKEKTCEALFTAIDIFVSEARLGDARKVFGTLLVLDSDADRIKKADALISSISEE